MRRFTSGIAVATLVIGLVSIIGATTASAAPSIVVTPSTGLIAGQVVTVSGAGFGDGLEVAIVECTGTATDQSGCDTSAPVIITTSSSGAFPATNFTVQSGTVGNGTCDTSTADLTCGIAVGGVLNAAGQASSSITFAAPATTTTTTTTTTVPITMKAPRRLSVTPSTNLRNGESVKVSGTGFTRGDHVYIVECLATVKGESQCDLKTLKPVTITGGGVLARTTVQVFTGKIGTGTCGTKTANLRSCAISVGNALKGDSAIVRISFK